MLTCQTSANDVRWITGERLEHIFEARCDLMQRSGKAGHIAVETDQRSCSFNELDEWANQLARRLRARGVRSGDRIGLIFDKTIETYVALLAVLKAQAAYVPLDPGFPKERIAFIAEDASLSAVLTMASFRDRVNELGVPVIAVDEESAEIGQLSRARLSDDEKGPVADDLCYVIYTSGTTGKPKGVAVDHASICNFVRVANEVYGYVEDDRVFQGMTIAFDFSVEELWVPLLAGATLVPGPSGANLVGEELALYLAAKEITAFCCVPTLLATVSVDLPDLRFILVSGEACPQSLVERWCRPGRRMLNAYGPTEATVTATVTELEVGKVVTIGAPLPTYTIVVLDLERDQPIEDGAMGEIAIAGIGLARGYLNRPELTKQKFVPDCLNIPNNPSKRLYRTGDLGRITAAGQIEFHGRIDTQVKIRGYRIELAEIESLIEKNPSISQAVVHTYESEPGTIDLVAYYALKPGWPDIRADELIQSLRDHLPRYMIPSYVERLAAIPMTSSNKVDRKALPPPTGPRAALNSSNHAPPQTDLEKIVAQALCETMNLERLSVNDNFFQDLGGHSLLMARFCSDIRRKLELPSISMRDIYTKPTVAQLCEHIEGLRGEQVAEMAAPDTYTPSRFSYVACGAAQVLSYVVFTFAALYVLEFTYYLTVAPEFSLGEKYLRLIAATSAGFIGYTALAVGMKWLFIGRWKPEIVPLWGPRYYLLWSVQGFVRTAPPVAFAGTPIYNLYLRMLGARVALDAVISAKSMPMCTDLVSIGGNTIVRAKSALLTHTAQGNLLRLGGLNIGSNVVVGEGSVVCMNTSIGDGGQLGHASSLQTGQTIPAGKRYHGSPAQETNVDYIRVDEMNCSLLRRTLYSCFLLAAGILLFPVGVLLFYYFFYLMQIYATDHADLTPNGTLALHALPDLALKIGVVVVALFFILVCLALAINYLLPRLLNRFLRADRTYVMFGFHHFVQSLIAVIAAAPFFNFLFGDSSAIVYYLRLAGYRFKEVIQTGANFGLDQVQDNPLLCEVGAGTMVSDGLKIVNSMSSASSFSLKRARIGQNNYLGNYIIFPADAKTDDDCLLATKVMLPIDGKVRRGVGLLGSPSFEIPRVVERDKNMSLNRRVDPELLARKNRTNAATVGLLLLAIWFFGVVATLIVHSTFLFYTAYGMVSVIAGMLALIGYSICHFIFIERASLGFGSLEARVVPMYDPYFLFHERHWKFCGSPIQNLFPGTPLRNVMCRLIGVKLGKMVFNDGCQFYDKTLIEIGDYANLNAFAMFQAHSLEEGVFKSERIKLGDRCTVEAGALVHYGVQMGDNVIVRPDSFIMKGEVLEPNTVWCGNPAKMTARFNRQPITSVPIISSSKTGRAQCPQA
jgi:non-ribosomal peptide synthetase-like protein